MSQTTTEVDSDDEWYSEPEEELAYEPEWTFSDCGPDTFLIRKNPVRFRIHASKFLHAHVNLTVAGEQS